MGVGKGFDAADSWNVALLFLIYAVLSVGIEHGVHWIKTKVKGKKTLMLVIHKAEEELFWAEREGQVVSAITDNASGLSESDKSEVANMVANITMYGVQGAVWNAMILLVVFVSIVNFLR